MWKRLAEASPLILAIFLTLVGSGQEARGQQSQQEEKKKLRVLDRPSDISLFYRSGARESPYPYGFLPAGPRYPEPAVYPISQYYRAPSSPYSLFGPFGSSFYPGYPGPYRSGAFFGFHRPGFFLGAGLPGWPCPCDCAGWRN